MTSSDKPTQSEQGFLFPQTTGGERSSSFTGRAIIADALRPLDVVSADRAVAKGHWHTHYPEHIYNLVKFAAQSPDGAVASAASGLDSIYGRFEFARDDTVVPLTDLVNLPVKDSFYTAGVTGAQPASQELRIPYGDDILQGDTLEAQLSRWVEAGIVEPSHSDGLNAVANHPEWLDLAGHTFVLLGAGAEMGPLDSLLAWGATVIAVDLKRPAIWQRLIAKAQQSAGTLLFPLRVPFSAEMSDDELAANAGVDLLSETPEIIAWLRAFDGPLTIGGYAYMDGQMHVRVVLAMDAIMTALINERPDASLAFLATPTDVFAVPEEAAAMAQARYDRRRAARLYQEPVRALSGGRYFRPNVRETISTPSGTTYGLIDSLVTQQGPNYALAKRLQQWRAIAARSSGVRVSANVAPATSTYSVVKNIALAAAYAGADRFGIEIFEPQTSNAVMAAQLIYDLRENASVANPSTPLDNPMELFMAGANHGGLWRTAFASQSVLEIAALLGWREARSQARKS